MSFGRLSAGADGDDNSIWPQRRRVLRSCHRCRRPRRYGYWSGRPDDGNYTHGRVVDTSTQRGNPDANHILPGRRRRYRRRYHVLRAARERYRTRILGRARQQVSGGDTTTIGDDSLGDTTRNPHRRPPPTETLNELRGNVHTHTQVSETDDEQQKATADLPGGQSVLSGNDKNGRG